MSDLNDPILFPLRTVVNKGHSAIFNDDQNNDMPNPPFPDPHQNAESGAGDVEGGFFVLAECDYGHYLRDLNYKAATGGTDKWVFQYLHGESEFTGTNYGGPAPRFGRGSDTGWQIDDASKEGADSTRMRYQNGCSTFWKNNEANKSLIYERTNSSLSKVWYTAITDNFHWGDTVTFSANRGGNANYVPAKGITFRYRERAKEDYGVGWNQKDVWKVRPLNALFMLFSTGIENAPVYLAEVISFSKDEAKASGCQTHSPGDIGHKRKSTGRLRFRTDWYYIKDDGDGGKETVQAGPSWNSMGEYKHNLNDSVTNSFPQSHNGTATATLSQKSVKKIMDQGLMCVGIIFGGQCYNTCAYASNETMMYEIFDTKLLVPEYYGDNNVDIIDYGDVEAPLMSMILNEPSTCEEAHKNWMASRQANHSQQIHHDGLNYQAPED